MFVILIYLTLVLYFIHITFLGYLFIEHLKPLYNQQKSYFGVKIATKGI